MSGLHRELGIGVIHPALGGDEMPQRLFAECRPCWRAGVKRSPPPLATAIALLLGRLGISDRIDRSKYSVRPVFDSVLTGPW